CPAGRQSLEDKEMRVTVTVARNRVTVLACAASTLMPVREGARNAGLAGMASTRTATRGGGYTRTPARSVVECLVSTQPAQARTNEPPGTRRTCSPRHPGASLRRQEDQSDAAFTTWRRPPR